MNQRLVKGFVIGTFVLLYVLVSLISTIHVIDFFELSNGRPMAIALAIAFEVGAAASLASLVIMDRMNKTLVWSLFITITLMQMQGNLYYAFEHLEGYQTWVELFDLVEEEPLYQKRVLSAVSGAILPLVALGFIKSLVDYIKPKKDDGDEIAEHPQITPPDDDKTPNEDTVESEAEKVDVEPLEEEYIEEEPETVYMPVEVDDEVEEYNQPVDGLEDEEALMRLAMEKKAKEDMDNYLNDQA